MIRRPPRSTQSRSSAASDVYKRQLGVYLKFSDWIKCGGRFVKNDKRCILVQGSGKGDFLCFAAGNFHAIFFEVFVKRCVKTFWHIIKPYTEARFFECVIYFLAIYINTCGNILTERKRKQLEVLKYHAENAHILVIIVFLDVNIVE